MYTQPFKKVAGFYGDTDTEYRQGTTISTLTLSGALSKNSQYRGLVACQMDVKIQVGGIKWYTFRLSF